ncbi:unnamed protein product, partial [Ceratitis capitata]
LRMDTTLRPDERASQLTPGKTTTDSPLTTTINVEPPNPNSARAIKRAAAAAETPSAKKQSEVMTPTSQSDEFEWSIQKMPNVRFIAE